jgi:hypothetical protein
MNSKELSQELGISEHYLLHHWKEIRGRWLKRGIGLVKSGKGTAARYGVIDKGSSVARFEKLN